MKKFSIALFALAAAVAIAPAAKADTYSYYEFTFTSSSNVVATGYLKIDNTPVANNSGGGIPNSVTAYNIVGGDVTVVGGGTFSLFPSSAPGTTVASPSGAFLIDNILYPTGGTGLLLDNPGVLFAAPGDTGPGFAEEVNIWGNYAAGPGNDSFYIWTPAGGYVTEDTGTFAITPTPEPGTLVLLGTGLLGLAFVAFRKAKPAGQLIQQA